MLSYYFVCLLSTLLSLQGSTLLLNTTDNDVRKFQVFVKVSDNAGIKVLASALILFSLID